MARTLLLRSATILLLIRNHMLAITGATGRLGHATLRHLAANAAAGPLVAVVRDPQKAAALAAPGVKIRPGDYNDPASLVAAFQGVTTVLLISGTDMAARTQQHRHVIDAARTAGVTRLVYTSGVNPDHRNVYYNSKTDSEKLALELAARLGLELVSVLPATMIGPENFGLNESYRILADIDRGALPIDPNIYLNWVDVRDVARACVAASHQGRPGERYLLAQERGTSIRDTIELLNELFPAKPRKLPPRLPRPLLWGLA